jgi:hypothetical protein
MRAALAAHSLADLTTRVTAKAPASFTISIANWLKERRGNAA